MKQRLPLVWQPFSFAKLLISFFVLTSIAGCNTIEDRQSRGMSVALEAGWHASTFVANGLYLTSFSPKDNIPNDTLVIFIEGDGLVANRDGVTSIDPSPNNPVGLKLALTHPDNNVAYLARPCQYKLSDDPCSSIYWTTHRYSAEVVSAFNKAISQLKAERKAKSVVLVGYSGGGTIAVLVAAQRRDVSKIITVAGNLDTSAWSRRNQVSLSGSLDPMTVAQSIRHVSQTHYVGSRDTNIQPSDTMAFVSAANSEGIKSIVVSGYDHSCCWVNGWKVLWADTLSSRSIR